MPLPAEVKQLCIQYLEKVRQDPEHNLASLEREEIIKAFAPVCFDAPFYEKHGQVFDDEEHHEPLKYEYIRGSVGYHALNCLGILSVKYALTRWDLATDLTPFQQYYLETARALLQDVQDFLNRKLEVEEALEKMLGDWEYFTHSTVYYDLTCLVMAAIYAFALILWNQYDPFEKAGEAYSTIDRNMPGEAIDPEDSPIPIEYNLDKRLEFWEWWLTEAIPEAWEIATKFANQGK